MDSFEISASIFMFLCNLLGIICSLVFISVFIINRQCRTMTTVLVLNSIIAGLILNIVYACQALYQINITEADNLCIFRGFLLHMAFGLLYHTFCLHALYRLFMTIPIQREYLQSKCITLFAVAFQWVISLTFGLPILWDNRIKYQPVNHICNVPLNDLYASLYLAIWIYFFPLTLIVGIYIRLIIYIKRNSLPTIQNQNIADQQQQRREFRLHRRSIMPVIVLFIMGLPYIILIILRKTIHVTLPPYTQKICFIFISLGQGVSMLLCLINTENVRKYLNRKIGKIRRRKRQRRIQCINVIQLPIQRVPVNPN